MRESKARHRRLIGSWAQAAWATDAAGVVVADSPIGPKMSSTSPRTARRLVRGLLPNADGHASGEPG
jgi:hypothetical protein